MQQLSLYGDCRHGGLHEPRWSAWRVTGRAVSRDKVCASCGKALYTESFTARAWERRYGWALRHARALDSAADQA